jgi:hypothetical protein
MQGAAALHIITPSIKFRNDASQPALNQPLGGDGGGTRERDGKHDSKREPAFESAGGRHGGPPSAPQSTSLAKPTHRLPEQSQLW